MADSHTHDLERVTRYGNGFSRFRCRTPSCDYWTDALDDEHTDEIARLRAEVTRLTREINDRIDYDKQIAGERDALRARIAQLVGALRFYATEKNWEWDEHGSRGNYGSCPVDSDRGQRARAALAGAEKLGT